MDLYKYNLHFFICDSNFKVGDKPKPPKEKEKHLLTVRFGTNYKIILNKEYFTARVL